MNIKFVTDILDVIMIHLLLLASLSTVPAIWCQPVQSQAEQLLSLLSPTPAVGQPWPSIPGPDLSDRVCIVGAGVSGVHMAVSLKKRNYQNVTTKFYQSV